MTKTRSSKGGAAPEEESDEVVLVEEEDAMEVGHDDNADTPKVVAPKNFDVSRSLRLTGLPTSVKDDDEDTLRELVCETVSSALKLTNNDWLESVAKLPLNTEGAEDSQMQALVVFKSRIHKHRVFTQRAKLEKPFDVFQITPADVDTWGLVAAPAEETPKKEEKKEGGAKKAAGAIAKDTSGDKDKDESGEPRFVINWDGAPEFQWRVPETEQDACNLVIENISIGDLDSPWLYQSMMRARNVQFTAHSSNFKGNFDHNLLRRGTLTLTYPSDIVAMSQAVNGLVCVRTRINKRIKIFLPQTPNTLRNKNKMEQKLGRIHKPNMKSRQLLVRHVGTETDEDVVKNSFNKVPAKEIESVEFRDDAMKRRCALVTFTTPEGAIWAHVKHDEVKAGPKNKWCRVFYMQDVIEAELLLKPELRDVGNPQKRARSRSRSPPGGAQKRTNIGGASGGGMGRGGGRFVGGAAPAFRGGPRGGGMMGGRGGGAPMGRGGMLGGGPAPRRDFRDERGFGGAAAPYGGDRYGGGAPDRYGPPMGAAPGGPAAGGNPMFQMQNSLRAQEEQLQKMKMQEEQLQKMKLQEEQLQMQNRLMQQTDLIKELADELKKVRGGAAAPGGPAAPAARPGYGEPPRGDPREAAGAQGYGRSFGPSY